MYTERKANSIEDFLKICLEWSQKNHRVLYRGHSRASYMLTPGIARIQNELKGEAIDLKGLETIEKRIFDDFLVFGNQQIKNHINPTEDNTLEVLSLAQHYKLPTRLLDWTSNPLAALFFAASGASKNWNSHEDMCIWAFCLTEDDYLLMKPQSNVQIRRNPFGIEKTYFFKPMTVTERIQAQAGWFSIHHTTSDGFMPLDINPDFKKELAKIYIPKENSNEILRHLNIMHINYSTIFPDITGTAEHLKWRAINDYLQRHSYRKPHEDIPKPQYPPTAE